MSRSRGGKQHCEEMSDDESEDDEKWASMRRGGAPFNELLAAQCKEMKSTIKSLQSEIRVLKSSERKTKRQLRVDYDWDGENANLSDKVSNWVKTYLNPRYKFLKDGWMAYDEEHDSLSSFVRRKMNMEDEDDFKGLWERVISPTIQQKYVTVRCNLNNEV
jgi:DNA polymerase sigma